MNDKDAGDKNAYSSYANFRIYESENIKNEISITSTAPEKMDLTTYAFSSYDLTQDLKTQTFLVTDNQLDLAGNTWKKMDIGGYNITEKTILSFDFRSDVEGEVQGIGFDTDNYIGANQFVQLYGTQIWANTHLDYVGEGNWQTFNIKLGAIKTGYISYLTFGNDHDAPPQDADSHFANIRLYEENVNPLVDSAYTGTADDDVFIFDELPFRDQYYEIANFDAVKDALDLSSLVSGYDPLTNAITDFIEITTVGADSVIKIDRDGVGTAQGWKHIATIENVTGLTDEQALVNGGTLVV